MSISVNDIVTFIKDNKRVIIAGDRQTNKTTMAAELITSSVAIAPSIRALYVGANLNMTNHFKDKLPREVLRNVTFLNYGRPDDLDIYVRGREYDLVIVDAFGEVPTPTIRTILATAQRDHSRVIFFTDIGTVRTSTIGRYPTIVIGSINNH